MGLTTTPLVGVIGILAGVLKKRSSSDASDAKISDYSLLLEIADNSGLGIYLYDIASGKEVFSEQLCKILKLDSKKKSYETFLEKLGGVYSESIKQAVVNLEKTKNSTTIVMNLGDGRQIECSVSGIWQKDTLTHRIISIRDSSAGSKLNEQLQQENKQLKRDIKQFSTILNTLQIPIWLRNADQSIRYCNMAYSMVAEESTEHKADMESLELHPYARTFAKAAYESGEEKSERRHIVIEGTRKYYQFTEIPVQPDGVSVGIAQDLTEIENVKEELQRHVNAQSELLEGVTSAMAVFGADMRLKFFNHAYVRLWGLEEAWLSSGPSYPELLEVLREKRRLPEQANFLQFKQQRMKLFTHLIEPWEDILYLPDGKTLRVLAIPHALGGILFAYEDVTDRLELERSYNTLIAVQRATLDNLHEGVVVFGEDGRLRLYNPRFLQIWKLEHAVLSPETHVSDLVEKTRALHHAEDWESYKQKFIANLLTREVQHKRIERVDGSVIDSVVVPLPDGASLITFYDVTDSTLVERSLRERNEALSEADRLKTEFLANVSYELRSPLTSINGFSEILTQNYFGELNKKQKEYVMGINQASEHLTQLINDILDIASIEAGYMKLNITNFDIYAMLQSVIALVSERMRESNLMLDFHCKADIGEMSADETRIRQIIFNLLSNAIKYSSSGSAVILSAERGAEEIVFVVEDHGIGIAPEEQKALFGKFHRVGGAASHKSGAGLGLSMVKSFIELHGGKVELFSVQGQGTKVTCHLPLKAKAS